jgi:purine-nucleoside phosphorylase
MGGKWVLFQAGRFHFYEGLASGVVVAPVRLAAHLGARTVILTNAAGGIAPELRPGSILLLDDHINLMGRSPLAGPEVEGEERFPDMSAPYDPELQGLALDLAGEKGIPLSRGSYAAVLGPSYETPAEIRFLRAAGADAVGMSTVPEVIAARALGMRVLAFSLITNHAAGLGSAPLRHDEVLEMGRVAGGQLNELIRSLLSLLAPLSGQTPTAAPSLG